MEKRTRIESGMRAEIRAENGEIYSGTISNIEKELEVTPFTFSWEEVQEKGWESRKWEAAVAVMLELLVHKDTIKVLTVEDIADYSFGLADALVKKFKEAGKCCK